MNPWPSTVVKHMRQVFLRATVPSLNHQMSLILSNSLIITAKTVFQRIGILVRASDPRCSGTAQVEAFRVAELVAAAVNLMVARKQQGLKQFPNVAYKCEAGLYPKASARACL